MSAKLASALADACIPPSPFPLMLPMYAEGSNPKYAGLWLWGVSCAHPARTCSELIDARAFAYYPQAARRQPRFLHVVELYQHRDDDGGAGGSRTPYSGIASPAPRRADCAPLRPVPGRGIASLALSRSHLTPLRDLHKHTVSVHHRAVLYASLRIWPNSLTAPHSPSCACYGHTVQSTRV